MPYFQFPALSQQVLWGTIAGEISLQSDLLQLIRNYTKKELLIKLDFSKYGELSSNSFIFPHILHITNGAKAFIVAYETRLASGSIVCGIKLNENYLQTLSEITVNTNYNYFLLDSPIELVHLDRITCEIVEANAAENLYFKLIIQMRFGDES